MNLSDVKGRKKKLLFEIEADDNIDDYRSRSA
jgi:hypothetical protein